jgi:hypothetical protein
MTIARGFSSDVCGAASIDRRLARDVRGVRGVDSMRILHLSTHDIRGDAARSAFRLHTALRRAGLDSTMLVAHRDSRDPTVTGLMQSSDFATRLRRRW